MKLQPDRADGVNMVSRHLGTQVQINGVAHDLPLLVPARGEPTPWDGSFDAVAAHCPEVLIYGSGPSIRFPAPSAVRPLIEARIGFETMDTAAACRTYNVLVSEGRNVMAALLPA